MKYLLLFLFACSSIEKPNPRPALVDQLLTIRPGDRPLLSNRAMILVENANKEKSLAPEVKEYDLSDEAIRSMLFDFRFVCDIGGKLYKICQDKPGFCRISYEHHFLSKKKIETYLPIKEKLQFLIEARTICFSSLKREYDELR